MGHRTRAPTDGAQRTSGTALSPGEGLKWMLVARRAAAFLHRPVAHPNGAVALLSWRLSERSSLR